jgi:hypothetical protein
VTFADLRPHLVVSNFDSVACTLTVEPWGSEITLNPDEQLRVHSEALLTGDVEVTNWRNGLQLCFSSGGLPRIFDMEGIERSL